MDIDHFKMGNICSCFSKSESNGNVSSTNHPFNQPGRTLDSAPPPQPAKGATRDPKSMGWGQSSSNQVPERGLGGDEQPQRRETDSDMRAAMAQAAEVGRFHYNCVSNRQYRDLMSYRLAHRIKNPRAS